MKRLAKDAGISQKLELANTIYKVLSNGEPFVLVSQEQPDNFCSALNIDQLKQMASHFEGVIKARSETAAQ